MKKPSGGVTMERFLNIFRRMEPFILERTPKSPGIEASPSGQIRIHGICMPEDAQECFKPFFAWLNSYIESPANTTTIDFQLAYFNTSTTAMLLNMFRSLSSLKNAGKEIIVNWHYEDIDSDIKEAGERFESLVEMEFNFIPFSL